MINFNVKATICLRTFPSNVARHLYVGVPAKMSSDFEIKTVTVIVIYTQ